MGMQQAIMVLGVWSGVSVCFSLVWAVLHAGVVRRRGSLRGAGASPASPSALSP
jgi:hypothetical protein